MKKHKGNRKRQYRGKKTKVQQVKRIEPPEDQSFEDGYAVNMACYELDPRNGKRTQFVRRRYARFPNASDMAEFFEQNCHQRHLKDM